MNELSPSQFSTAEPLFRDIPHSAAIVYAVLEQNSPGRVYVDKLPGPNLALLYAAGAFFYLAGDEKSSALSAIAPLIFDEILPQMAEKEVVLFTFSETMQKTLTFLGERGMIQIRRKIFRFDERRFAPYRDWRKRIPEGYRMADIDLPLAEQFPEFAPVVDPGSKRFGVCLLDETGKFASSCTAIFVGRGEAEVDIHTEEQDRGRGFATLTASAFIETCLLRKLCPSWACWPERQASGALARKLGFQELPDVPVFYWAEGM